MKINVYRKKQFASILVSFGIVVGYEKEKLIELIKNLNIEINNCKNASEKEYILKKYNTVISQISIYPIKNGETIKLTTQSNQTKIFAINFNFYDTKIYPFAVSNELTIRKNTNILLKQSSFFSTVKLSINEIE